MDQLGRDLGSNRLVLTSVQPLDQRKKRGVREGFEGGFARESDTETKDLESGRGRRLYLTSNSVDRSRKSSSLRCEGGSNRRRKVVQRRSPLILVAFLDQFLPCTILKLLMCIQTSRREVVVQSLRRIELINSFAIAK